MENKKYESTRIYTMLLVLMIVIVSVTFISCSAKKSTESKNSIAIAANDKQANQNAGSNSFDVNVDINYKITLDDNVKGVNSNIIKAARQGIFDYDINNARLFHYNYAMNYDIYIFDVEQTNKNTWSVKFWEKPQDSGSFTYDKNAFCAVLVTKQDTGIFIGFEGNPGGPNVNPGETY